MKQDMLSTKTGNGQAKQDLANGVQNVDFSEPLDAESLLRAMCFRLSHLSTIRDLPFENRLEAMRTSLIDGLPTTQLKPLFEEIIRFLDQREQKKSAKTPQSPSPNNDMLSLKFLQMLDGISSPSAFVERIEPAKELLRIDADNKANNSYLIAMQSFFDELNEFQAEQHKENIQMQAFLHEVTNQLQDIRQFMHASEESQQDASESGEALGRSVNQATVELEDSIGVELNFPDLKNAIQKRISTIRSCMVDFKNSETNRFEQSAALIKSLYNQLKSMEQETMALKARLTEKGRQYLIDSLTTIPNRMAYEERIQQECERYIRNGTNICLLVCDVDNFKDINDTYGHAAGDKVLKQIAEVLQHNTRSVDFVARYGGEEFVIIMNSTQLEDGTKLAEKLRKKIEMTHFMIKNVSLTVSFSGGVAEFGEDDSPASLFERADNALYIAKECGKNRIESQ